jgi:hypothetical protein
MHKTVWFAVVVACLCAASAWAEPLSISPTQFYVFDIENFVKLFGATLGQVSTVVTYTNGTTVLSVNPQLDSDAPTLSEVWVPIEVSMTVGRWDVRVIATDADGSARIYGPAALDIIDRPQADLPPPSLPEVLVVEAGSESGAELTFDSGGASCNYASGAVLPVGTTTVTCTVGGATDSFTVVVTDTRPPVLTLPSNLTTASHTVTFAASALDNIDGPIVPVCEPASGSSFPDGVTTVECVATDSHANSAAGTFTVTVSVAPPVLHLPADVTREATGAGGSVVTYTATADGGTIQCSPVSGALFPLGTTTVQCSATNPSGTSTGSFHVSVVDTTPPTVISTIPSESTLWPPNHKLHGISIGVMASDAVDPDPVSHIVSVSSNQPKGSGAPDWVITGALTVELRAERTAALGPRIYTIGVATSDSSGGTTLSSCTVTVPHDNQP